jgi:L-asparaginase
VWGPVLSFIPAKLSTYRSELTLGSLPASVTGYTTESGAVTPTTVAVKDEAGHLLASALPKVTIVRYVNYGADDFSDGYENEVEVLARIKKNLEDFPLGGFIAEGSSPYGAMNESMRLAMQRAVMHGMPVLAVSRGTEGFVPATASSGGIFLSGSNLSATKARILLMACLLKFGALPAAADPDHPTAFELEQIRKTVALYQHVVNSH